jgi:hypothetical protein
VVPPDLGFVLELDVEPEVVRERELVLEPLPDVERVVFELEPVLRDREVEPVLRAREVREVPVRPREPVVRDVPPLPDLPDSPPPSSSESPFEPSSFFPTPTAAAVARPTAAPVATFFGVDIPSFPSSSDAMVSPPSVPR